MTAHHLRTAAAKLREVPAPVRCRCKNVPITWFDRSICPPPCEMMHTVCEECGNPVDGCAWADVTAQPTPQDVATADWLEAEAGRVERDNAPDYDWTGHPALAVANAVLADQDMAA